MPRKDWGIGTRWDVHVRDKCRCVYGSLDGADGYRWDLFTNDHLVPFSRGGSYEMVNLVTACLGCNYLKADYDPRENDEPVTLENTPRLIQKAKDEIDRRRRLWQDDFRAILRQAGRL
jgi:5-methylcytosine-specific restriction endonuclease McrA